MVTRRTINMDSINFIGEHNLCEEQDTAEMHDSLKLNLYVI